MSVNTGNRGTGPVQYRCGLCGTGRGGVVAHSGACLTCSPRDDNPAGAKMGRFDPIGSFLTRGPGLGSCSVRRRKTFAELLIISVLVG